MMRDYYEAIHENFTEAWSNLEHAKEKIASLKMDEMSEKVHILQKDIEDLSEELSTRMFN